MTEAINEDARGRAIERCRERGILIPTFAQMRDPERIDPAVGRQLPEIDMQALDPLNLFRITWKNDPADGGFGEVNAVEFPSSLTGVPARIVGLVGKHFPTGPTRSAPPSGAWSRGWLPGSSIPRSTRPCGPPRATTAGAEPSTAPSWGVRP